MAEADQLAAVNAADVNAQLRTLANPYAVLDGILNGGSQFTQTAHEMEQTPFHLIMAQTFNTDPVNTSPGTTFRVPIRRQGLIAQRIAWEMTISVTAPVAAASDFLQHLDVRDVIKEMRMYYRGTPRYRWKGEDLVMFSQCISSRDADRHKKQWLNTDPVQAHRRVNATTGTGQAVDFSPAAPLAVATTAFTGSEAGPVQRIANKYTFVIPMAFNAFEVVTQYRQTNSFNNPYAKPIFFPFGVMQDEMVFEFDLYDKTYLLRGWEFVPNADPALSSYSGPQTITAGTVTLIARVDWLNLNKENAVRMETSAMAEISKQNKIFAIDLQRYTMPMSSGQSSTVIQLNQLRGFIPCLLIGIRNTNDLVPGFVYGTDTSSPERPDFHWYLGRYRVDRLSEAQAERPRVVDEGNAAASRKTKKGGWKDWTLTINGDPFGGAGKEITFDYEAQSKWLDRFFATDYQIIDFPENVIFIPFTAFAPLSAWPNGGREFNLAITNQAELRINSANTSWQAFTEAIILAPTVSFYTLANRNFETIGVKSV